VQQPQNQQLSEVGQIELASFINPEGLLRLGENLFAEPDSSGAPKLANPGTDNMGKLLQGSLEWSNVEPVQELIDLITTQRAFELNSQVISAADQILEDVVNLRRY